MSPPESKAKSKPEPSSGSRLWGRSVSEVVFWGQRRCVQLDPSTAPSSQHEQSCFVLQQSEIRVAKYIRYQQKHPPGQYMRFVNAAVAFLPNTSTSTCTRTKGKSRVGHGAVQQYYKQATEFKHPSETLEIRAMTDLSHNLLPRPVCNTTRNLQCLCTDTAGAASRLV